MNRRAGRMIVGQVLAVAVASALLAGCQDENSPEVEIGALSTVKARLAEGEPLSFHQGRGTFYVVAFPKESAGRAEAEYPAEVHQALKLGVLALSQRSPDHGARLPWCSSSGWFEDPIRGQKFSGVGEYIEKQENVQGQPPHGMYLYPLRLGSAGRLVVDTSTRIPGVPLGTETVDHSPLGPRCVG